MCTAFPYCRFGVQRLLEVIHAIIFTGGFMAGPWTLRPKRLQWPANMSGKHQKPCDLVLCKICHIAHKRCVSRPVSGSFSFQNSVSSLKSEGAFPPAFTKRESGAALR
jgi:hypothetical protein